MKKIGFYLMSRKGYEALLHFIDNFGNSNISFVVAAKDENVKQDYYQEIKALCLENKVTFFDRKEIVGMDTDYLIAISWRWLIKAENARLIVMHDSLLPKYRGFAPLVNCLVNAEKMIGVTALFASEEYDKGDIIAQQAVTVNYPVKIYDAIELVSGCYKGLVAEVGKMIISGQEIVAVKQKEADASYSLWLDEDDYQINWSDDAERIKRFIDATGFPYNAASTVMDKKKYRVTDAEIYTDLVIENRAPGKIIFIENGKPVVVCGKGLIKINSLVDDLTAQETLPLKRFRIRFS